MKRYEVCIQCGHKWNISVHAEIPQHGYVCPYCYSKNRKRGAAWRA
jgi:DNA-directed RNA polymerase subunit RPC12/RpoP